MATRTITHRDMLRWLDCERGWLSSQAVEVSGGGDPDLLAMLLRKIEIVEAIIRLVEAAEREEAR